MESTEFKNRTAEGLCQSKIKDYLANAASLRVSTMPRLLLMIRPKFITGSQSDAFLLQRIFTPGASQEHLEEIIIQ